MTTFAHTSFRALSALMAALFGFGAAVQLNDPDPLRWVAMYAAASTLSIVAARRPTAPGRPAVVVGIVALIWSALLAFDLGRIDTYRSMFEAWEMRSVPVEISREVSGLLLIAAWMGALGLHAWRMRGR